MITGTSKPKKHAKECSKRLGQNEYLISRFDKGGLPVSHRKSSKKKSSKQGKPSLSKNRILLNFKWFSIPLE